MRASQSLELPDANNSLEGVGKPVLLSRLPPPKREKRANPRERPALIALKVFVCKSPELLEFQAGTFRKESWKIGLRKEDEVKESRMI
ncbi:hypothetical protein L1987_88198 [Smallanthus sonchifolius]|nr:hypothetical protein L1987_88198 [Smallanthus sonchifolius]